MCFQTWLYSHIHFVSQPLPVVIIFDAGNVVVVVRIVVGVPSDQVQTAQSAWSTGVGVGAGIVASGWILRAVASVRIEQPGLASAEVLYDRTNVGPQALSLDRSDVEILGRFGLQLLLGLLLRHRRMLVLEADGGCLRRWQRFARREVAKLGGHVLLVGHVGQS
uniref:(northern house mosquito) hypothetical protein n=1 Tax=Culex pipiens TaxID=7175 RepID=A0A8D8P3A5_CULPI